MCMFSSDDPANVVEKLTSFDTSLPMKFLTPPEKTKMFKGANNLRAFEVVDFAYNSHTWATDPAKFKTDKGLKKMFRLTSTNTDPRTNLTFSATIEGVKYPFFSTLFHPEKQIYQQNQDCGYNRSKISIDLNRHFGDTFIKEARKNKNTYDSKQHDLIENYKLHVTLGEAGTIFLFP